MNTYRIIVVGAGSAGAIIASRLSTDPTVTVLLIEAGPDYPERAGLPEELRLLSQTGLEFMTATHNWHFVGYANGVHRTVDVPRGRVTGGTSAINSCTFIRGEPGDYDGWAAAGNARWSFSKVLPRFRDLESDVEGPRDYHGQSGPIPVQRWPLKEWVPFQQAFYEAATDMGFEECGDHNMPSSTGVGPLPANRMGTTRVSTALAYLNGARRRPNLHVLPRATVHRVLFKGVRAVGVLLEVDGRLEVLSGDEIVLSAGAIGSPKILLQSGVGPASHLSHIGIRVVHELPGVGMNLKDHPFVRLVWEPNGTPPLLSDPRLQIGLRCASPGSDVVNDSFIVPTSFVTAASSDAPLTPVPIGVGIGCVLTEVESTGSVLLQSADPHVPPVIDFNFLSEPRDLMRMAGMVRLAWELSTHRSYRDQLGRLRVNPLRGERELRRWLKATVTTAHHASSTCRMGPVSDPAAVVDDSARVHGLEGLRVADASIMPNAVRAVPNATVMMIGEHVGALMRDQM